MAGLLGARGSLGRGVARGGAWNSLGFAVHAAAMFALSPFVVARLGLEAYGAWEVVIALTGYLGFADLGVAPATVHWVARRGGPGAIDLVNATVNSAFVVFCVAGAGVLAIAGVLAWVLPTWFHVAPGFADEARIAFLLTAAYVGLALPMNAFSAVLVARLRYDLLVKTNIAALLLRTAGIVAVLASGQGLVALAGVNAATELLSIVVKAGLAFRVEPGLRVAPRRATRLEARRLLSYGGQAILISLALQLVWATHAIVIGAAISAAAVGVYAVGTKLAFYARDFFRVMGRALEPVAAALDAQGEAERLGRLLGAASRTLVHLYGPVLLYLLLYGEAFLSRWMGDERFHGDASDVLRILAVGVAAPVVSYPFVAAMYGMNRLRLLTGVVLLEGALNLGLSVVLAGPFGLVGVAVGTAIPAVLVHVLLVPRAVGRLLHIAWARLVARTWLPALAAGILAGVALPRLADPQADYSWSALIGLAIACVAAYALPAWGIERLLRRSEWPLVHSAPDPAP